MSLYEGIAEVYDDVFPLRPERVSFAAGLCRARPSTVLDIGCATGSLALELARQGHAVTALDLDRGMVEIARARASRAGLDVRFDVMDMRDVGRAFAGRTFDLVLCLGNALVHLGGAAPIGAFLTEVAALLAPAGRAALQHIVYDRHLAGTPPTLPVIDNPKVRFVRSSRYDPTGAHIVFATELTVKATGAVRREVTHLYPLRLSEVLDMLSASSLSVQARYADFAGRPAGEADSSHIVVACRA